jgi:hypothetical protein
MKETSYETKKQTNFGDYRSSFFNTDADALLFNTAQSVHVKANCERRTGGHRY